MEVILANPRGFCAGVDRAIAIVERALESYGAPIYVRHEVVHNRFVVEGLRARGAIFVEGLDDVPDGATLIFSAHGVPQQVRAQAEARGLRVFDATCPLVTKVHMEVARLGRLGKDVVLVGHAGHPEVEGTMGQWDARNPGCIHLIESLADVAGLAPHDPGRLAYVTQTTLSVDDTAEIVAVLRARFPAIEGPKREDICYATTNRQAAVKAIAPEADLVLVIGSPNSSNSQRLREVAERAGARRAILLPRAAALDWSVLAGIGTLGVTAGASAPDVLVDELLDRLGERYALAIEEKRVTQEDVVFKLPGELCV